MSKAATPSARLSLSDWTHLMTQYEAGTLTQRVFCDQHGLAYSTFSYWRKQLRLAASVNSRATPSATLIELPMLPTDSGRAWRVELDLGQGVTLRMK